MRLKGKLMLVRQEKNISFQKTLEYLMEDRDYSDLKVQNIIGACNVSASGAIHLYKYLGLSGSLEFKYLLVHETEQERERVEWESNIRRSSDEHLANIYEVFQKTHIHLDTVQMNRMVERFHEAGEIVVLGLGSSWIIAKDLEPRPKRIKKNCQALNDINLQYFAVRNAGRGTIFWGIIYSGTTRDVLDNLGIAREEGTATILMTHHSNRQFEEESDYIIHVYGNEVRDRRTPTINRFAMLYLVDMIHFMRMNRYSQEVTACLDYNSKTRNQIWNVKNVRFSQSMNLRGGKPYVFQVWISEIGSFNRPARPP